MTLKTVHPRARDGVPLPCIYTTAFLEPLIHNHFQVIQEKQDDTKRPNK